MKYVSIILLIFLSSCGLIELIVPPDTDKEAREGLQKIKPYYKVEGFYSNGMNSSSSVKANSG